VTEIVPFGKNVTLIDGVAARLPWAIGASVDMPAMTAANATRLTADLAKRARFNGRREWLRPGVDTALGARSSTRNSVADAR
jgi:hypothetical protein